MAATSSSVALPVAPGERIESLNALRGLALFGVLMVNLLTEFGPVEWIWRCATYAKWQPWRRQEAT